MSAPANGNYVIYNRALSLAGEKMAVTLGNDVQKPLTVQKLGSGGTQTVCRPPSLLRSCLFSHYEY